jgi:hypothetical protein
MPLHAAGQAPLQPCAPGIHRSVTGFFLYFIFDKKKKELHVQQRGQVRSNTPLASGWRSQVTGDLEAKHLLQCLCASNLILGSERVPIEQLG